MRLRRLRAGAKGAERPANNRLLFDKWFGHHLFQTGKAMKALHRAVLATRGLPGDDAVYRAAYAAPRGSAPARSTLCPESRPSTSTAG